MKYAALGLISALSLCSTSVFADFDSAKRHLKEKNYGEAATELTKLAQVGHVEAQFQLASLYEQGLGVTQDLTTAYAWYLVAKDFDHPDASDKYRVLREAIPSRKEGKDRYRELSNLYGKKQHEADFAPVLKQSNFYPERAKLLTQVEPDYTKSTVSIQSAWATVAYNINESGQVEDARVLASFPKNVIDDAVIEAISQWTFKPAVKRNGDPDRVNDLMHTFKTKSTSSSNHRKYEKQLDEYTQKLKELADSGNNYAQVRYAMMLEHSIIESPTDKYVDWYYKAAMNGNNDAQLRLVHCFENGEGCQPNEDKAFNWLEKASQSDNYRAQFQLAKTLLDYQSVHFNPKRAVGILKEATHNQYLPAMTEYARLLAFSDNPEIRDIQAAIKYAELARSLDPTNPVLLSVLGASYTELGRVEQGEELLQQAFEEAQNRNWPTRSYLNLIEGGAAAMMANGARLTY
ncbi:TonB family protein [Pseudoalteromonas tunicata]|uniref:TonB family protein n=1 Tax=Pseudoalteromonas tunicata TaxID=314281 RepID=UPI00273FED99|nr:TonB family protein [Pseudoalteromonas tunicata]MDP5215298.1 TonB family protein [Pseudoalteromonas tunicata]